MTLQLVTGAQRWGRTVNRLKPYLINADWDAEAQVWVATSDDVPGLATESATLEALGAKLDAMVPELLEANAVALDPAGGITYELVARRFGVVTTH